MSPRKLPRKKTTRPRRDMVRSTWLIAILAITAGVVVGFLDGVQAGVTIALHTYSTLNMQLHSNRPPHHR